MVLATLPGVFLHPKPETETYEEVRDQTRLEGRPLKSFKIKLMGNCKLFAVFAQAVE